MVLDIQRKVTVVAFHILALFHYVLMRHSGSRQQANAIVPGPCVKTHYGNAGWVVGRKYLIPENIPS